MDSQQEKILIVDDEALIRRLLRQKLTKEGYWCEEAENAEQALDKLKSDAPELVLLDTRMQGKSGIEMLLEIKTGFPNICVIMATAVNEISIAIQCMNEGADDYICKPFNLDEVALTVTRALGRRRLQLMIEDYRQNLEQKIEQQTAEIRKLFLGAIEALVFALESKDSYTAGHSRRVTELTNMIGKKLHLSLDEREDLRWGSLLHDVGKIAVDQIIQNKPGRLTPEEYEHIMIHAHVGAGIVKTVVNDKVVEMIEHHHDHYDGSGLHQVLKGEEIPVGARILGVADAFDAMTSDRSYRTAISRDEALDEIKRCAGTQFDPAVVNAFFEAVGDKKLDRAHNLVDPVLT